MGYRKAWQCRRCPKSNGPDGCPAWVEYVEKELSSGRERLQKECVFQALPKFLVAGMAASERTAATVDAHRNEIVTAMEGASRMMQKHITDGSARALIEDGSQAIK